MRTGGEREYHNGQWQRHGPPHRHISLEVSNIGGDMGSSRVP